MLWHWNPAVRLRIVENVLASVFRMHSSLHAASDGEWRTFTPSRGIVSSCGMKHTAPICIGNGLVIVNEMPLLWSAKRGKIAEAASMKLLSQRKRVQRKGRVERSFFPEPRKGACRLDTKKSALTLARVQKSWRFLSTLEAPWVLMIGKKW